MIRRAPSGSARPGPGGRPARRGCGDDGAGDHHLRRRHDRAGATTTTGGHHAPPRRRPPPRRRHHHHHGAAAHDHHPPPFPGDTEPKSGTGGIGLLTGVRFGDHEDYIRIVFDFQEPSFPNWEVAYVAGEIQGEIEPEGGWVEGERLPGGPLRPGGHRRHPARPTR